MGLFDGKKKRVDNTPIVTETTLPPDSVQQASNALVESEQKYLRNCAEILTFGVLEFEKDGYTIMVFSSEFTKLSTRKYNGCTLSVKSRSSGDSTKKYVHIKLSIDSGDQFEYVIKSKCFADDIVLTADYPDFSGSIEVTTECLQDIFVISIYHYEASRSVIATFEKPNAGAEGEIELQYFNGDPKIKINDVMLGYSPGMESNQFIIRRKESATTVGVVILQRLVIKTDAQSSYLFIHEDRVNLNSANDYQQSFPQGGALLGVRVGKPKDS